MTSETRDSRRAERRAARQTRDSGPVREPAVLRTPGSGLDTGPHAPVQQVKERGWNISMRVFSGLISVSLIVVLAIFFSSDAFYVHSIGVSGTDTMTPNEVFALADVAGMHVFWVDPAAVRTNVLRSPTLADARVTVGWGSPAVSIEVQERRPALVWDQAGVQVWVDVNGRVMRQRGDAPDLLRVVIDDISQGPPGADVDRQVVNSAIQLQALLPDARSLRYHPDEGLGYADARGWDVWFGVGDDMDQRVRVYEALINDLQDRGIRPGAVYLINPDRPWYTRS
ncbi:MAG TPA: FtsQ-type POTRA domain-containing protein [Candidatus Limnocylindrales bacterium]|jgi:hypothetical protein|nr:FtsQ-type POTRA domain-containing protein [Candidatus Limnocylindrales bacterium]